MRNGLDVSHWQYTSEEGGGINYVVAKEAGIEFLVARTTNGKTYDKRFQRHFDGALKAGLMAAGYHYFRPRYSNQGQVDSILENLDGRQPAFYTLDVETSDGRDAPEVRDDVWQMMRLLESNLSCPIIIYTAEWFWGSKIRDKVMYESGSNRAKPRANYYPLWVASYPTGPDDLQTASPDGSPLMPRGWRDGDYGDGPYEGEWEIWQYTSKLVIPNLGGSATVDGNIMKERFWVAAGGAPTVDPIPDPEPDPFPPTDPVEPPSDPLQPWGYIYTQKLS